MTRIRARAFRGLLLLLSLAAGLALAEVLVGVVVPDLDDRIHYAVRSRVCCRPDPDAVWSLRPGIEASRSTEEFDEHVRTGALGLRGADPVDPRDRPRILAVGDSFTFGTGVDDDQTWEVVLAASLAARDRPAEVLNAGVPGYGFDQGFRAAQKWSARLAPDLVLFGLHCTDVASDWDVPLWDLRDGRLVPLDPSRNWIALQMRLKTSTPDLLRGLRSFRALVGSLRRRDPFGQLPALDWAGTTAWQRDKVVAALAFEPIAGDPRRAAVIMPCKEDLSGDSTVLWADLPRRLEGAGVPVLDAGRDLRPPADPSAGRRFFFDRDIHLTPAGNRWLAARIERFLVDRGLLHGLRSRPGSPGRTGPGARRKEVPLRARPLVGSAR